MLFLKFKRIIDNLYTVSILVKFVDATNQALSVVESPEFRDLLPKEFNPPCRKTFTMSQMSHSRMAPAGSEGDPARQKNVGVPQGSTLGPLLFQSLSDDCPSLPKENKVHYTQCSMCNSKVKYVGSILSSIAHVHASNIADKYN